MKAATTDRAISRTDLTVRRWDQDQTEWAARRLMSNYAVGAIRTGRDVAISPRDFELLKVEPYSVTTDYDCNLIVQTGWVPLLGGIAGTSITNKFDATHGRIGVGTVSTAAVYADVKLGGDTGGASTTSYYKLCGAGPTITTASTPPTLVFTATFGTAVANFAWAEFGIDNHTADSVTTQATGSVFFNHGISSQGTKAAGQTWTATVTISFGFPSGAGTVS